MAANSQSQHRCVFVGNIPYDATEEQLIQICEEVGPVVSFRLVIDRETGKPKGYGFCEYKDEETALSARRNLQGYEINGRQLRVDFAENDKNADRNREQGRGGPGVFLNADASRQFGGPALLGHPSLHQPIGDSVAMAAATVMAGALGSAQTASTSNHIGLQRQPLLGTDPLTRHLAKMSRSQLIEIVSEIKAMATQNKEQARQLLLAIPALPKALFQAQIMLGMVPQQMLQMPNIRQASAQPVQSLVQSAQNLPGLPPLPQNKMQLGVLPYAHESGVSTGVPKQYAAVQQIPTQSQIQRPQLMQNQVLQQGQLLAQSGVSTLPSIHHQSLGGLSVGPQTQPSPSSFDQMQHPLSQNVGSVPPTNSGYNYQPMSQNAGTHPSMLVRPQFSAAGFQPSSSTSPVVPEDMDLKGHALSLPGKTRTASNSMDLLDRASKMVKLNEGRATPSSQAVNIATPLSAPFPTSNIPGRQSSRVEETQNSEKQPSQMQLPPDVDSTLLQQVLSLTPEQLRSLPPDQQQQVIQLQQMLRQAT
ncbi:Cleavage stimulating factor 64 [Sesamum alatum]|uniref:Cleavage stimulating factor 64 n=1 Tax=Sesamum alatum TaxID=300844 RepID=A0AAE2CFX9_9LAMI|nr:Cleavage stimulating factor 64 [Sesamum alatum]